MTKYCCRHKCCVLYHTIEHAGNQHTGQQLYPLQYQTQPLVTVFSMARYKALSLSLRNIHTRQKVHVYAEKIELTCGIFLGVPQEKCYIAFI